eukprot:COSAG01_NODE_22836_length_839_cov_1.121622_2_plen_69_part_01
MYVNDVNDSSQFCAAGISQFCSGMCRHMLCDVVGEADRRIVLMIATRALQGQRIINAISHATATRAPA